MAVNSRSDRIARRLAELRTNDPQFAAAQPDPAVDAMVRRPELRMPQLIDAVLTAYADRPALGERVVRLTKDPATGRTHAEPLPQYRTITYAELTERTNAVGAALAQHGVRPGDRITLLGANGIDYTVADLAATKLGAVPVPLPLGVPVDQLAAIIAETAAAVQVVTVDLLPSAVELALTGIAPGLLVVLGHRPEVDDEAALLAAARAALTTAAPATTIVTLGALITRGAELPVPPLPDVGEGDLALLLYTSGSTGTPKGVEYTDSQMGAAWRNAQFLSQPEPGPVPWIILTNLPMGHLMGRHALHGALAVGGTAYFPATNDMTSLLDDLSLIRPTVLGMVPRMWDVVYQRFQDEVARRRPTATDLDRLEADVTAELRQTLLGGRQLLAVSGAAAISGDLAAWVDALLDLDLADIYGSTEAGQLTINGRVSRPWVVDYRLVDVPELGYFRTDRPYPRGELQVKTLLPFTGYYRHPDSTADVLDADGWFHTGDIFAELAPDLVKYVDRRSTVQKLAQGEFVAVSKLEAVFADSPLVHQIFVYGNSTRAYLLAVVVPNERALADPPSLKRAVAQSFQDLAKTAGLQSYEIPRDFLVETTPFSQHNGLLTGVGKPARRNLVAHYGERLEDLYAALSSGQDAQLRTLREQGRELPTIETVTRAATALLGSPDDEVRPDARFADLGGDSLSALTFVALLAEIYAVDVPVSLVVSPVTDLRGLAAHLDAERFRTEDSRPTFASIHGRDAGEVSAADLTLERFLDPGTLASAPGLAAPATVARKVLLTGATGFLGRFLVLDWLEQLAGRSGRLVCLVRAKDDTTARERLDSVFEGGDPALAARYHELAAGRLDVVAGDKGEPWLGLDRSVWQQLAETVDLIADSAALVNHVLPYSQLFGPNVLGTAELIRFALTGRLKRYVYASTIAVGQQIAPQDFTEDADIRVISPARKVLDEYASGYGTSKWAGEVLLREANERFGLPVAVFRCDLILAETRYRGQVNAPDMFSRLLLSLVATGIAPGSFYRLDSMGRRQRSHYDGLPVDFVARVLTTVRSRERSEFGTYHVTNPHDDGIGLDEFVDWLIEAGQPIERVPAYDEWLERFETALRALPDKQRQASVLPLLQAYRAPWPAQRGSLVPTARFTAAVRAAGLGDNGEPPSVTPELIAKYVTDLQYLGLLD